MIDLPDTIKPLILHGDVIEQLRRLPAGCVQCAVTSPPYFGLRSYKARDVLWGGDANCQHVWVVTPPRRARNEEDNKSPHAGAIQRAHAGASYNAIGGRRCSKCGGWFGQLGAEPTPKMYVAHIVMVCEELKRVLRDDGVFWLNLGDSHNNTNGFSRATNGWERDGRLGGSGDKKKIVGIKAKSLFGIPWRVALALQDNGWILRSDCIWYKRNPMPDSAKDRPTRAHEYVFMLVKGPYYYDQNAERIPNPRADERGTIFGHKSGQENKAESTRNDHGNKVAPNPAGANMKTVWDIPVRPYHGAHFACVDSATEALTDAGWKTGTDIKTGDRVAQFDPRSFELSWAPAETIAVYDVKDTPMVVVKHRDVDMLLTPNHRTLVSRRLSRKHTFGQPVVVAANDLKGGHRIPVSANWGRALSVQQPSVEMAELLGWFVTEGTALPNRTTVDIAQSIAVNRPKVDRIKKLLDAVDADYDMRVAKRIWQGRDASMVCFRIRGFVAADLRSFAPEKAKSLPWAVLQWDDAVLRALFDGLIGGDGHCRKDDGRLCFIQNKGQNAEVVQAIAVRLGYATKQTKRKTGVGTLTYFTKKRWISIRGAGGVNPNITKTLYTGKVWCPKVPTGFWLARRNGRTFITGNTFPPQLPARCIRLSTSTGGACVQCGAPYERVIEKGAALREWQKACGGNDDGEYDGEAVKEYEGTGAQNPSEVKARILAGLLEKITKGWEPTCDHPKGPTAPCVVMDIFAGSGTTLVEAHRQGRRSIGIELGDDYVKQIEARLAPEMGLEDGF